jgi:thioesterase domain-containing protein
MHPVGGGVSCYEELTRALPFRAAAIPALSLQDGAPLPSSIEQMAEAYVSILAEEEFDEPLVLAGWSLGGLVAYQMAANLSAQGRAVPLVIMIDSYMSLDDVKPEVVAEAMSLLGGRGRDMPREFSATDPSRLAHVFRANLAAARRYRPPVYHGRVLLLRAMNPDKPADLLLTSSWSQRASQLRVAEIDADHYSILQPPALGRVLEILSHAS